jgi:uncharacterized membrane protein
MQTPASIAKHPIHPMLIVFPIGLWVFSFICDVVFKMVSTPVWNDVAFYTMAGGLVGALLAALPGFIDMLALREREPRRIAWTHMALNLVAVALYALNLYLRAHYDAGAMLPFVLSLLGVCLLGVSGWLGGELAYVHRVGVQPALQPVREAPHDMAERMRRIV